jgi:hypothetical protein
MNKKLSEKEIDDLVIIQADDENAWTIEGLKKRAKRGSREKFLKVLNKVSKTEPDEEDKIK